MKEQVSQARSHERLTPLLSSIQREINERTEQVRFLEQRLEALGPTAHAHAEDVARIRSELSTHRRELRRIESELRGLGIAFDADNPHAIVEPQLSARGVSRSMEDTGFRPRFVDSRA